MFLKLISVDNRDLCNFSWIKKELRLKKFYKEEGSCSSSLWRTIGERRSAYSCCFCRKSTTVCRYSYGSYYSSFINFPFGIPLATCNPYFISYDSFSICDSLGQS